MNVRKLTFNSIKDYHEQDAYTFADLYKALSIPSRIILKQEITKYNANVVIFQFHQGLSTQ